MHDGVDDNLSPCLERSIDPATVELSTACGRPAGRPGMVQRRKTPKASPPNQARVRSRRNGAERDGWTRMHETGGAYG
jgi:hypothetical protein